MVKRQNIAKNSRIQQQNSQTAMYAEIRGRRAKKTRIERGAKWFDPNKITIREKTIELLSKKVRITNKENYIEAIAQIRKIMSQPYNLQRDYIRDGNKVIAYLLKEFVFKPANKEYDSNSTILNSLIEFEQRKANEDSMIPACRRSDSVTNKINVPRLREIIRSNKEKALTLKKMRELYIQTGYITHRPSVSTIQRCLKRFKVAEFKAIHAKTYTFAKNLPNRDQDKLFLLHSTYLLEKGIDFVFFDESTFKLEEITNKRWYLIDDGEPVSVPKRQCTIKLLLAINHSRVVNAHLNDENTNQFTVARFVKECFNNLSNEEHSGIESLPKQVFVFDNASWHKTKTVKSLFYRSDKGVLLLPSYQPMLNSAELVFSLLKRKMRQTVFHSREYLLITAAKQ